MIAEYLQTASLTDKLLLDALVLGLLTVPAYRLGRWAERRCRAGETLTDWARRLRRGC